MTNPFADAPVTMRPELVPALGTALEQLGQKGDWLDGERRLAVAREARNAWTCAICRERKDALSPYAVAFYDIPMKSAGYLLSAIWRFEVDLNFRQFSVP